MSKLTVIIDDKRYEVEAMLTPQCGNGCVLTVNGEAVPVVIPDLTDPLSELAWIIINERPYELAFDEDLQWLKAYSGLHRVQIHDQEAKVTRPVRGDGRVKAPIPGLITRILVQEGDLVHAEQALFILEAMKMENEIRAPFDGTAKSLSVSAGQVVAQNDVLAEIVAR